MKRPTAKLIWKTPPPAKHGHPASPLQDACEQLRKKPGKWAIIREYTKATSCGATAVKLRSQYPGHQFTSRGTVLYGRYIGEIS